MLTFSQMTSLCLELNAVLHGSVFFEMKEIEEKKWVLIFTQGDNEHSILLSLQGSLARFHLTKKRFFAKESSFTNEIQKVLKNSSFQQAKLLGQDRILQLEFSKGNAVFYLIVDFIPRQQNVFLLNEKHLILASAEGIQNDVYKVPDTSTFSLAKDLTCSSQEIENEYALKEQRALFEAEKKAIRKNLAVSLKKLKNRLEHFQQDLEEGKKWAEEKHLAELLQSYFFRWKKGMDQIELEDWQKEGKKVVIPLDPSLDPAEELKLRFKRSQKLKRKEAASRLLAEKVLQEIKEIEEKIQKLDAAKDLQELEGFQKNAITKERKKKEVPQKKEHPYREFTTEKGLKIYVGKKDVDNDSLTFSFAHGNDIWLHASDVPGSHVILRGSKKEPPDQESLLDAMQIALHFSKAGKEKAGEVVITECKNVQKLKKGKPGQVTISHHKKVFVKSDPARLSRLFSKLLPGQALP